MDYILRLVLRAKIYSLSIRLNDLRAAMKLPIQAGRYLQMLDEKDALIRKISISKMYLAEVSK